MIEDFQRLVDSLEFEEYGQIVLTRCDAGPADLTFGIVVEFNAADQSLASSSWTVRCADYRRFRIEERVVSSAKLLDDHVVIAACDEKRYDLYFTGRPVNPFETAGRLAAAHRAAARDWLPLSEFLNPGMSLDGVFMTEGGLVAERFLVSRDA